MDSNIRSELYTVIFQYLWNTFNMENKVRKAANAVAALLNGLPKVVSDTPTSPNYPVYLKENMPDHAGLRNLRKKQYDNGSLISVVLIVSNDLNDLRPTVLSVLAQTYKSFELIIASESRIPEDIKAADERIVVLTDSDPLNAVEKIISGEYVMRLFPGDRLEADALRQFSEYFKTKGQPDAIYADNDLHNEYGMRRSPVFKPAFSPVAEIVFDHIIRPFIVKTSVHKKADGFCGYGSDDMHAYIMRCIDSARRIDNISKILLSVKTGTSVKKTKGFKIDRSLFAREGMFEGSFRICKKSFKREPTSIIIGDVTDAESLKTALEALEDISVNFDSKIVICVGKTIPDPVRSYLKALKRHKAVSIVTDDDARSIPALLNRGAANANSKNLVFFSSCAVIRSPDSISELVLPLTIKHVAVTGGKLLKPDRTLYNTGTVVGLGGKIGSPYFGTADDMEDVNKCFYTSIQRNVSAVSGCMMAVSSETFLKLGMFDERLNVFGWDSEFCIRAINAGMQVVYTPFAEARLLKLPSGYDEADQADRKHYDEAVKEYKERYFSPNYDLRFTDPQLKIRSEH